MPGQLYEKMTGIESYAAHIPSVVTHIRRADDSLSLCDDRWGVYAVAEPGANLPHLLPVEEMCERCVRAHVAGSV